MKKIPYIIFMIGMMMSSCQNQDWEFPNFDYQTVYFAYQYPVRTITFGEDIFDTSLDNEGKFRLMVTTGGVYSSPRDVSVQIEVDESIAEGLLFEEGGDEIEVLSSEYYQLSSNTVTIPRGQIAGGVEVQLTGAFFNDPRAIKKTFVLPVKITNVINADSILSGIPIVQNPRRAVADDWFPAPKDFTLYAVKYINDWHGFYLRRGRDVVTAKVDGINSGTITRRQNNVENDQVNQLFTESRSQVLFPVVFSGVGGQNITAELLLTFSSDGSCTVSASNSGFTASGSGKFVKKGEKSSWGNQDRDAIYLQYEIDLPELRVATTDTLVARNRGVVMETFSPVLK
ncbi:DUF5627 domain-containing protein [Belliella kenyensis]|uniref:DUF5627 domain-containing protein n=1 Tax=Belliella kenyensis TaxID=1472724 RepID=A0ABV8ERD5_9BACT|nr:DUF5627 domain-containing protein [Belliella kenyensis]MCH7402045.1 DUF5627 domain-containing protein [Belliella kenyensis]MDN3605209.1 DUF5627 domain-containing protein [Belliella kenyensis]